LGSEEAKIRVELKTAHPETAEPGSDITETAKDVIEKLLAVLGVEASVSLPTGPVVEEVKGAVSPTCFDIAGEDLGILIGRRGQTVAALQYIVRLILSQQTKSQVPIVIDVDGYKRRRYEALRNLALRMAEQVKTRKVPFTLEPMPAYERRIIHLALANHPDVTTQSIGEGETRKVVILLKER
jgi:spoIIIJ-associated protein